MGRVAKVIILILGIAYLCSCSFPTSQDKELVKALKSKYGEKYSFDLGWDIYFDISLREGVDFDKEEAIQIFKEFCFQGYEQRKERHTQYIYLNYFDHKGRFLNQVYYNPTTNSISVERSRPYY